MNTIYDAYPEKFYLLSIHNRRLIDLDSKSEERILEEEVEKAFSKLPGHVGGNIYAIYVYDSTVMDVMSELSNRFKFKYPQIQQLPAYFKNFKDGDTFIKHNFSAPMLDIKRSIMRIKALEMGVDANKLDSYFLSKWGKLYLSFETFSYGFLTDKIYVGEPEVNDRVCRFCGKSGNDIFKEHSHAIQDALGNKLLFCNEECDEYNHFFEKEVERHLYKFLEIPRTLANVTGKGSRNHHLEGINFHIHPDPTTLKPIVFVKQEHIINDSYKGRPTGKICLYNKGKLSYQGIYKALVKIAIDMMPNNKMQHFIQAGRWVHGDFEGKSLPIVLYGEHGDFFSQPILDLFFRNEHSPENSPYCTAILYIFGSIFIYIVPFNDKDGDKFSNPNSLRVHWNLLKQYQYLPVKEWEEFDSNDKEEKSPIYKIPIMPLDNKYDIQYRPSWDEVFKIERK